MRMEITKLGIEIIPENVQDIIYIESFLCLKSESDIAQCIRINVSKLSNLSHIKIIPNKMK